MIALLILAIAGLYLVVSTIVVYRAVQFAKRNGRSSWRWGGSAALVMYLLVFWDHVPVLVMHKYYCEKDAGFWVYRTPEQWGSAHPHLKDQLRPKKVLPESLTKSGSDTLLLDGTKVWPSQDGVVTNFRRADGTTGYWLNERFLVEISRDGAFAHAITREEQRLRDTETGEILAQSINYWRGSTGQFAMGFHSWTDFKLWLGWGQRECSGDEVRSFGTQLGIYANQFLQLKKGSK